jgi:hypothetical protein
MLPAVLPADPALHVLRRERSWVHRIAETEMSDSDLLTEDEIVELTGKTKQSAQLRALEKLGIRATPRPGRNQGLLVCRAHRDAALGLRRSVRVIEPQQVAAPNFAALD